MTLTIEEKIDLARYRQEKARRFLDDAQKLFAAGSYGSSVNRSYYAILLAARSLLILRGIDPESHEGVKTMLTREFIRPGLMTRELGETFRILQSRRMDSDYGDYIEIDREEAEDSLTRATTFLKKIDDSITELIKVEQI